MVMQNIDRDVIKSTFQMCTHVLANTKLLLGKIYGKKIGRDM